MGTYLKQAPPPAPQDRTKLEEAVRRMLADIARDRDDAVRRYARELDKWESSAFRVADDEIRRVERSLPDTFKADFAYSLRQVTEFAKRQLETLKSFEAEIEPGIFIGQKMIPIARVGCYVPGGKFPLVASAIMSVGTARVAGCDAIVACAPPRDANGMYPYTLYALHASGANEIYNLGGVQAMAAMAYGCVGMKPVDMVTGAGNPFVAESKRQLFGQVGIDLLAEAEHGPDSPAWLVTTSRRLGEEVLREVDRQLETLATARTAGPAWR